MANVLFVVNMSLSLHPRKTNMAPENEDLEEEITSLKNLVFGVGNQNYWWWCFLAAGGYRSPNPAVSSAARQSCGGGLGGKTGDRQHATVDPWVFAAYWG